MPIKSTSLLLFPGLAMFMITIFQVGLAEVSGRHISRYQ
jgi:hypothetical protein